MAQTTQPSTTLYETDFYAWTQQQAALMRNEELERLDLPNLIEEIEAMGRRERRELTSRLKILLTHLLKWQFQPDLQSRSWRNTINSQRAEISDLLADSPSLRPELAACIATAYPRACHQAQAETGLLAPPFPATCPYAPDQILDADFFPTVEQ
jgi:hypothetical protein